MKNHKLTISLSLLILIFVGMSALVVRTKAQEASSLNPYDDPNLDVDGVISLYHNNMNTTFNNYITLMMTNIDKNPDDPEGKAVDQDGNPLTASQCMDDPNNYSTFCVAVNTLGGNIDNCVAPSLDIPLPEDMQKLCSLGSDATPLKGYLNFVAALKRRSNQIFQTTQQKSDYIDAMTCLGLPNSVCDQQTKDKAQTYYQTSVALQVSADLTKIQDEISKAKDTLDQTLSAYDQLKVAWPIHKKYVQVYADLEKYRDKIVDIRHQTDVFPSKFIDMTTTACL